MKREVYAPSGCVDVMPCLVAFIASIALGWSIGLIYGAAMHQCLRIGVPTVIQVIGTILTPLLIGAASAHASQRAHVRNRPLTIAMGFLAGSAAVHASWVAYLASAIGQDAITTSPVVLLRTIASLADTPIWIERSASRTLVPSATQLILYWISEAVILAGGAAMAARSFVENDVYCERCRVWVGNTTTYRDYAAPADPDGFSASLRRGDFTPMAALSGTRGDARATVMVDILTCPVCRELHTLSITQLSVTPNATRGANIRSRDIIRNLLIDSGECARIEAMMGETSSSPSTGNGVRI